MQINNTENEIKQIRRFMWLERLVFFPIKLVVAYLIYLYFDDGIFFILAYILFRLGEQSSRQFVNSHELNATIKNTHETLGAMILEKTSPPFEKE